jgi:hypothetical protein
LLRGGGTAYPRAAAQAFEMTASEDFVAEALAVEEKTGAVFARRRRQRGR